MFPLTRLVVDDLVFRPFGKDDTEPLVIGCNDPELQRWLPLPFPYTRELASAWVTTEAERRRVEGEGLHLAIADAADQFLGNVSLKKTHWRHGHTEVGYWVMPAARGRGIATAAAGTLSRWALQQERIFRVELTAAPGDIASQRVAEKAGFSFEGIARSGGIIHSGRTDLKIYSLIRADLDRGVQRATNSPLPTDLAPTLDGDVAG